MAKFFVALTALVLIAGCSCNKDAADTTATEAPATGDAAAPSAAGDAPSADAGGTPTDTATPENMGAATATPAH